MMDPGEREQYKAAIRGDRDAFEMIIRTQSRALFAIAYGILQSREEAEDAVQDALIKAWKSRWRVRDPEKFPAWLGTITRFRARDLARRRRSTISETEMVEAAAGSSQPETERQQQLQLAMQNLPELHRTALALRYFENMDYAAIEQTLGLSNGALRGILGRALGTLRKQLKPTLTSSIATS